MSTYELVERHDTNDDGFEIPESRRWQVYKNGQPIGDVFLIKKEAEEALNGYINTIDLPEF